MSNKVTITKRQKKIKRVESVLGLTEESLANILVFGCNLVFLIIRLPILLCYWIYFKWIKDESIWVFPVVGNSYHSVMSKEVWIDWQRDWFSTWAKFGLDIGK
jgi:hypothetical protein